MMTLHDAARALAAHEAHFTALARFESVGTDSRALAPGQLFVALRGERFDGHDFVDTAAEAGAAAASTRLNDSMARRETTIGSGPFDERRENGSAG